MNKITRIFADGNGGYCVLGALAHNLGVSDIVLGYNQLEDVLPLLDKEYGMSLACSQRIMTVNDEYDSDDMLNEMLKVYDLPIRIRNNSWITVEEFETPTFEVEILELIHG